MCTQDPIKSDFSVEIITSKLSESSAKKPLIAVRAIIILLGTFGTALVFCLRVNISVAIIAMVNMTASSEFETNGRRFFINDSSVHIESISQIIDQCPVTLNTGNYSLLPTNEETSAKEGNFVWNQAMQGVVLGAYYYGYATTQIIGGRLAEKYGGRWLCGFGILISALATLLTPIAAELHIAFIIIVRMIIGISHGTVYTSLYVMLALWCPKTERATALSLITVGGNVGAALTMPLSSYLMEQHGWQSVFYVTGSVSIVWFFAWIYYARDSPSEHPSITLYELNTIHTGLEMISNKKDAKAPWKHILSSPAVWAIAAAKSCGMFGYYLLSTKLPTYLDAVLNMPTQKNGYINAMTYVSVSITMAISGRLTDYIKQKYGISLTLLRKVFETIALTGTAICLASIPTFGCDENAVIIVLLLAMFVFGFTTGGDIPIVADIAPHFSGTIFGVTNTISVLAGVMSPIVVGLFVDNSPKSVVQWSKAFYFAAGLGLFGNVAFCLWTTAVPQHWGLVQQCGSKTYDSFANLSTEKSSEKKTKNNDSNTESSVIPNLIPSVSSVA